MRRLLTLGLFVVALGGAASPSAIAAPPLSPPPCGLPATLPMWIDYADGQVPFWQQIFAHPGVVAAASKLIVPPQLRAAGAQTVYFDLNLKNRVGTPSAPADPSLMVARADTFYDAVVQSTGCQQPFVALNELSGVQTPTPWTDTITQYRSNISAFLGELSAKGARPFLLLSQAPYTQSEAGDWLRQISTVADLVPEVYFNGRILAGMSSAAMAKKIRATMRTRMEQLLAIRIPTNRVGMMLTFSSTPGAGGREGLQPLSKWLDVVQQEVVAAKDIAKELKVQTVWSWGWANFNSAGADADKNIVACVYLWVRDPTLCDAPTLAGDQLNESVVSTAPAPGQLCVLGATPITANDVTGLTSITGDRDVAFSASFQRLVLKGAARLPNGAALQAEKDVIAEQFAGDRTAYLAALRDAHATVNIARDVLADQLRRRAVETRLKVTAPTTADIANFYEAYAAERARSVHAGKSVAWLGGSSGIALGVNAPPSVFGLETGASATLSDTTITANGPAAPLAAFPLAKAQRSIRTALTNLARGVAFDAWVVSEEKKVVGSLSCSHDKLPDVAPVDLTDYLPFLSRG